MGPAPTKSYVQNPGNDVGKGGWGCQVMFQVAEVVNFPRNISGNVPSHRGSQFAPKYLRQLKKCSKSQRESISLEIFQA